MQYELKNVKAQGLPYDTKDDKDKDIYVIPMIVYSGIVGNTYDGKFLQVDETVCKINRSDNSNQIETKMEARGAEFVAQTYPNT